jgi:hypothetical protein
MCRPKQGVNQTLCWPKITLNKHLVELNSLSANTVCQSEKFVDQNTFSAKNYVGQNTEIAITLPPNMMSIKTQTTKHGVEQKEAVSANTLCRPKCSVDQNIVSDNLQFLFLFEKKVEFEMKFLLE